MQILKSLGGVLVESIDDCTHLVTDRVRRTLKFLCGVARGLLVVDAAWLERCKKARKFVGRSRGRYKKARKICYIVMYFTEIALYTLVYFCVRV